MWPNPIHQDFDLNEFESTLSEAAFTNVTASLGIWFLKDFFYKFLCKFLVPPPYVVVQS